LTLNQESVNFKKECGQILKSLACLEVRPPLKKGLFMSEYEYRFCAVRGLERRKYYSPVWNNVTGAMMETMTAEELRQCADAIDDEKDDE
jgi:hypothetical protein